MILFLIAINAIYIAFDVVTPDFMFVCLALGYLNIILTPAYSRSRIAGISCGIMGALLYLAKAYGLPFFIVHFFVINLILYIGNKDKSFRAGIRINYVLGMVVFLLICIPWILLISNKYGYLTIGTSGKFNHALVGPNSLEFPMHYAGLLAPPNASAICIWEDISNVSMPDWSLFNSFSNVLFQIVIILKNIAWTIIILSQYSFLSLFVLAGSIIYLLKQRRQFVNDKIFLLLVSMLILFSGYLLILVVYRYLWLCDILLIIIGAKLLELFFKNSYLKQNLKKLIILIFAISFLIQPVSKIYNGSRGVSHIVKLNNLITQFHLKGRFASDKNWHDCVWLAYFNDWKYYGEKGKLSDTELEAQLERYDIDYFILWTPEDKNLEFIENYSEITNGTIDKLKIYDLNQPLR